MAKPSLVLLYRATCGKCRALSLALVLLSLGWVRRVPLSSPEASEIYSEDLRPGKVVLVSNHGVFTGWHTLPGLLAVPLLTIFSQIRKPRRLPPA